MKEAIASIQYIRKDYPNIEIINKANQAKILKELNDYFGTNFSKTDIWAKKTTIINQYIYFRNHLALFEKYIGIDNRKKTISLKEGQDKEILKVLSQGAGLEKEYNEISLKYQYIQSLVIFILFGL